MLEFLTLLKEGILCNTKIADSFKEILESLLHLNVLELRKNRYFLRKNFCIGKIELTREGYGFVVPLLKSKMRDWLVEKKFLKGAQKGDIVVAKILKNRGDRIFAKIIYTLEAKEKSVLCYLEKYKLDCIAISIPNEIPYKIKATQKSLKTLPANTILRLNPRNGEILEVLGTLDTPSIDEKLALEQYFRTESFSINAQLEAESFKEVRLKDFNERVDYTHLPFCAIDPLGAKDHDDAVFYDAENSTLYVAIADVSYYVKEDSALDLDAKKRGFSIYFPHKSIPMLPRVLSENLCSLNAGVLRLAMVFKIRLHRRTKVVLNSELFEAVIKVKQKLTYEEVDILLETKTSKIIKNPIKSMLLDLHILAQKLREKRLKVGFDFVSDEKIMELDKNLLLKAVKIESQSASHTLIEECMLLANIESAKLQEYKTTQNDNLLKLGIYRIHPKPKPEDIIELLHELKLLNLSFPKNLKDFNAFHTMIATIQKEAKVMQMRAEVDKLIIKSMQQASYASHNIGHFGLGFATYSHFTSPIRRYSDLILHRILKDKIKLKESIATKKSLPQICENLSQKEREVAKIEMDFKDRKFARFLYPKIGQSFIGIITNDKKPELVVLQENPLQGARVICLKGMGVKYQKVRVQIIDVNLATAKIYGRIIEAFNEGFGLQNEQITKYLFVKKINKMQSKKENAKANARKITKNIQKNKQRKSQYIPRHKRKKGK